MKKLLLPLALLGLGLGGGVGAGLMLAPPQAEASAEVACAAPAAEAGAGHGEDAAGGHGEAADHGAPAEGHGEADAHGNAQGAAPCEGAAQDAHGDEAHGEASSAHGETGHGETGHGEAGHGEAPAGGHDYVKLPNQFIVPVVEGGEVAALMLMSLSVEVPAGAKDGIAPIEPKLRDSFLQVLFDHANTGGFAGMFTASSAMRPLRAALVQAAEAASEGLVTDVLIVDMVREDR